MSKHRSNGAVCTNGTAGHPCASCDASRCPNAKQDIYRVSILELTREQLIERCLRDAASVVDGQVTIHPTNDGKKSDCHEAADLFKELYTLCGGTSPSLDRVSRILSRLCNVHHPRGKITFKFRCNRTSKARCVQRDLKELKRRALYLCSHPDGKGRPELVLAGANG
ncbi:MAG: hypothetical protein J5J00_08515 [Deltaproteobacteria bacterium]|nr:hypothetical protein [Deltaproteobacteria bacterium]